MFERIQEDIDSERDRITSTFQAMLNNAEVINRFNDVEDQLQMTLGVHTSSSKWCLCRFRKLILRRDVDPGGTIGMDQAYLDFYPKPVELNGVAPAIL